MLLSETTSRNKPVKKFTSPIYIIYPLALRKCLQSFLFSGCKEKNSLWVVREWAIIWVSLRDMTSQIKASGWPRQNKEVASQHLYDICRLLLLFRYFIPLLHFSLPGLLSVELRVVSKVSILNSRFFFGKGGLGDIHFPGSTSLSFFQQPQSRQISLEICFTSLTYFRIIYRVSSNWF